ncbi:hypothetical protein DPMN_017514 [Dreissena polymorpha]|uniref:Uncharacterized protein n=1 Tax=Dreissena polymorpha TaxID=45954 RepID=A0A9D4NHL7_DREPO|nr:hypothetical protein DPMN_017514 [Dreissena polymorpha]
MCPDSYCINEVTNKEDGSKWVDRRQVIKRSAISSSYCGFQLTVSLKSHIEQSAQRVMIQTNTMKDIHCTYCCTTENCNRDIKPAQDTLYVRVFCDMWERDCVGNSKEVIDYVVVVIGDGLPGVNTSSPRSTYTSPNSDLVLQYFCENINNVNCSRYAYDVPCGTDGRFYPNM